MGEIRGVVVDAAIRPIPGVRLSLQPGGLNATTDAEGAYHFEGLRPGSYALHASHSGYAEQTVAVQVDAGLAPRGMQLLLEALPSDVRYSNVYKLEGYFECGISPTVTGCSTANILTGILLCSATGICANFTGDRSYLVQWVDPGMVFLQSELNWQASLVTGESLTLTIGGATPEELPVGTLYNVTHGPSPLAATVSGEILEEAKLGSERIMLVQVSTAPAAEIPGGCGAFNPCGPGFHAAQPFQVFTITFYGYTPPSDWRFSLDGSVPPPPPERAAN